MLKLSRLEGESIELFTSDGIVTIEFEQMIKGNARVAIFAPKDIRIVRTELLNGDIKDATQKTNRRT